jgi:hypothetical protein
MDLFDQMHSQPIIGPSLVEGRLTTVLVPAEASGIVTAESGLLINLPRTHTSQEHQAQNRSPQEPELDSMSVVEQV